MVTDFAPEFDTAMFVAEGDIWTFKVKSDATNAPTKGDLMSLVTTSTTNPPTVDQSASGEKPIGVAMKSVEKGANIPILISGIAKLVAKETANAGDPIKSAAGAPSKFNKAVRTVVIPTGATTVTSTSAQPSMTVESGIAFGRTLQASDGDGSKVLCIINCII